MKVFDQLGLPFPDAARWDGEAPEKA